MKEGSSSWSESWQGVGPGERHVKVTTVTMLQLIKMTVDKSDVSNNEVGCEDLLI